MQRSERNRRYYENKVSPYLGPSERLLKVILAIHAPFNLRSIAAGPFGFALSRHFYIGVTDTKLYLVECDLFSTPIRSSCIPMTSIQDPYYKTGLLSDTLTMTLPEYGMLKLRVFRQLRKEGKAIVSILESRVSSLGA